MRLRHQAFHTFKELNLAIRELMNELNQREMKQYGASRQALFDKLDKPALKPLPRQRYLYTETKRANVGPDYHIEYRRHYYSVPHQPVGHHVELEASNRLVQIYHQGNLVDQHPRSQRERGTALNQSTCQATINIRSGRQGACLAGEPISARPHEKSSIRC